MDQIQKKELLEKIDSYIKGNLPQEEIENLWIEFLKYPDMYRYFETEVQIQDMIKKRDLPENFQINRVEEPRRKPPPYKLLTYAAVAALIVVVGMQFLSVQPTGHMASRLALTSIDLDELVGSDLQISDSNEALGFDLKINSAIAMAHNDSIEMSINTFRDLLNDELNDCQFAQAELDIGILLYNESDYKKAKKHFSEVIKLDSVHGSYAEKGWWFYGNTLLNTGELKAARDAIQIAHGMNGRFQEPAFDLIKKMDAEIENSSPGAKLIPS